MDFLAATALIIKLLFAAGVLAALIWFVLRPVIHSWRQHPDPNQLMPKLPDLADEELQIPVDPNAKPSRERMLEEVRADPRRSAMVLREWLREKGRERKQP